MNGEPISSRQQWREFLSGLAFYLGILFAILFLCWLFFPVRDRGSSATDQRIGDVRSPVNVAVFISTSAIDDAQMLQFGDWELWRIRARGYAESSRRL